MSSKRLSRILERPKDYTWDELAALLNEFGYKCKNASGSRRKFIDSENRKILLHEPHPNPILKAYAIDAVICALEEHGKI